MDVVSLREKIERAERDHLELINVISQASTDSEFRKVALGAREVHRAQGDWVHRAGRHWPTQPRSGRPSADRCDPRRRFVATRWNSVAGFDQQVRRSRP